MNTIMVWMLISTSSWSSGAGVTTSLGYYKTLEMCEHVRDNIPAKKLLTAKCIQAEVYLK